MVGGARTTSGAHRHGDGATQQLGAQRNDRASGLAHGAMKHGARVREGEGHEQLPPACIGRDHRAGARSTTQWATARRYPAIRGVRVHGHQGCGALAHSSADQGIAPSHTALSGNTTTFSSCESLQCVVGPAW